MRVAVVSAPRSGSMWVAHSIADALGVRVIRAMEPEELPAKVPVDCVMQIHWLREPPFLDYVEKHGIKIVTVRRHPLDAFLSAFWLAGHGTSAIYWLGSRAKIPWLKNRKPCAPHEEGFLDWCVSDKSAVFLASTTQWWEHPDTIRVCYEDCVADPLGSFVALSAALGVDVHPITKAQLLARNLNHIWQAFPGIYKRLVLPAFAAQIAVVHAQAFAMLGYQVDDYDLPMHEAVANWERLGVGQTVTR